MNRSVETTDRLANKMDRRRFLAGSGLAAAGLVGYLTVRELLHNRASVFIARNQRYEGTLVRTIRDGLVATGIEPNNLRGKRVLLKPNLVEPQRDRRHMTTNPAMVSAAAEVFRDWGAEVVVGEAPGHIRDTEMALYESGIFAALDSDKIEFADLNYDEVVFRANAGRVSKLKGLYFPRAVVEADLIVSMPKMKTHHWMGVTASMKNLYGTLPGIKYGWPKNVLHYAGIPKTVYDISASLPNCFAIVDAIECMEGDGPILGTAKHMGLVVVGTNLPAVDATVARLMDLNPTKVAYLQLAANRLGPIADRHIVQRGESWQPLAQTFAILDEPHLTQLRDKPGVLTT
jgi:uncharacterized protein (DUF362 family)